MLDQATPLATAIASLRTSAAADGAPGLLRASLQSLILALLTRLFARLESLVPAWQAGTLAIPPPVAAPCPAQTPIFRAELTLQACA
ncbi:MAG: hypothetical protein IT555_08700 [Acetobacteraceae bacterium]|nr:hypothetical protein [Acetobacteraceae bacterium]